MKEPDSTVRTRLISKFENSAESLALSHVSDWISKVTQDPKIAKILRRCPSIFSKGVPPEVLAEVEEARRQFDDEMQSMELPIIRNVEDWIRLARIVEIPESEIETACPKEIKERAFAWVDRERIRSRIAKAVFSETSPPTPQGLNTEKKKGSRGRKKADYETQIKENTIFENWKQAYENKIPQAKFAKDLKMNLKALQNLINRVSKRKSRSDN